MALEDKNGWETCTGREQLAAWVRYVADFARMHAENVEHYNPNDPLPHPEYRIKTFVDVVLPSFHTLKLDGVDLALIQQVRKLIDKLVRLEQKPAELNPKVIKGIADALLDLKIS